MQESVEIQNLKKRISMLTGELSKAKQEISFRDNQWQQKLNASITERDRLAAKNVELYQRADSCANNEIRANMRLKAYKKAMYASISITVLTVLSSLIYFLLM